MAITHVVSQAPTGNPTTSFTLVINAGVLADDLLILSCTNRDATTNPSVTDNDTGGNAWARLDSGASGLSVWWKRATSATASKTITAGSFTGSSSAVLSIYRGASKAATPYANATQESNASGDASHAGFTTTRAGSWVFLCVAQRTNDIAISGQTTATSPGALAEQGDNLSTGGLDCANSLASAEKVAVGSTGAFSWTPGTAAAAISTVFELLPAWTPLTATLGTFTETGNATGLTSARRLTAAQASVALTGQAAALNRGRPLAAATRSFALSGNAAGLNWAASPGVTMSAAIGSFTLTGNASGLRSGRTIGAGQGALSLSAAAALLEADRRLSLTHGSIGLSAATVGLARGRLLSAAFGSVSLAGTSCGLRAGRGLAASVAAFALSSTSTGTRADRRLAAVNAAIGLSGIAIGFATGKGLTAAAGLFTASGHSVRMHRIVLASAASFDLTGIAASLATSGSFVAGVGLFELAAATVGLVRTRSLLGELGSFVVVGSATGLSSSQQPIAFYVLPVDVVGSYRRGLNTVPGYVRELDVIESYRRRVGATQS